MPRPDLDAIRKRWEATTPGEWEEEWRPVVGYEGLYDVSNMGQVRSYLRPGNHKNKKLTTPRLMAMRKSNGRNTVSLTKDGRYKSKSVSRLVAEAFHGPCPDGKECAHLNGDASDNRAVNLEWVTHLENESHKKLHGTATTAFSNGMAKLVGWKVAEIKFLSGKGVPNSKLCDLFDISRSVVSAILKNKTWADIDARLDIPALLAYIEELEATITNHNNLVSSKRQALFDDLNSIASQPDDGTIEVRSRKEVAEDVLRMAKEAMT